MAETSPNRYLALPESGKGPGILVLHAWWGLNDFIRGVCDRLAQAGFVALAPDMFNGKTARTPDEAEQLVSQAHEEKNVPPIILPALDDLARLPQVSGKRLGTMGFSFGGGWAVWLAAQKPEVRAVVNFYSAGWGDFTMSQASFMGHFAETDPFEPKEGIEELERDLKAAGRPTRFYTYPGTGHWFFEQDRPGAYDPQAARLAWERTIEFLDEQLKG